jgi:hypothetical protein
VLPALPGAAPGTHLTDTWQLERGLIVPLAGVTLNTGLDRHHS